MNKGVIAAAQFAQELTGIDQGDITLRAVVALGRSGVDNGVEFFSDDLSQVSPMR